MVVTFRAYTHLWPMRAQNLQIGLSPEQRVFFRLALCIRVRVKYIGRAGPNLQLSQAWRALWIPRWSSIVNRVDRTDADD
jgi:hypothetical protein